MSKEWYRVNKDGTEDIIHDSYFCKVAFGGTKSIPLGTERVIGDAKYVLKETPFIDFTSDDGWEINNYSNISFDWDDPHIHSMMPRDCTLTYPYSEEGK